MFKNIPFYGNGDVIKSIKQIDNDLFEFEIYDEIGNINKEIISLAKEEVLQKYLDQINNYLFYMKDKYKKASDIITSDVIKRNSILIFISSIIVGIGFPFIGYAINSALVYYLGFVITGLVCVPAFIYSLEELIFKKSEKDIKASILEYDNLELERDRIKQELDRINLNKDVTKFSAINSMKQEDRQLRKKLVKKKE